MQETKHQCSSGRYACIIKVTSRGKQGKQAAVTFDHGAIYLIHDWSNLACDIGMIYECIVTLVFCLTLSVLSPQVGRLVNRRCAMRVTVLTLWLYLFFVYRRNFAALCDARNCHV